MKCARVIAISVIQNGESTSISEIWLTTLR